MSKMIQAVYRSVARTKALKSILLLPFYVLRFLYFSVKNGSLWFYRYPPGHYGSPLPGGREIRRHRAAWFSPAPPPFDGVKLNPEKQLALLDAFAAYHDDFAPNADVAAGSLYHYRNAMFGFADGLILYAFLRHFKPARVIEVGSGFSSGLMLDTARALTPAPHFTFIDPYSTDIIDVLKSRPAGSYDLVRKPVQEVDLSLYAELAENDILFIDSSHVVKIGSDLSTILYSILPSLKAGVIVHFHDIYYPFEYHEAMLMEGRAWNEIYLVRAFLQFNSSFEILFFNSFVERMHGDKLAQKLPNYSRSTGNSLWLRKTA